MIKTLLVLPILLLGTLPAEAHGRHYGPGYRVICDQHGCSVRYKQPKVRINEHCVWKPWKNRTICRY